MMPGTCDQLSSTVMRAVLDQFCDNGNGSYPVLALAAPASTNPVATAARNWLRMAAHLLAHSSRWLLDDVGDGPPMAGAGEQGSGTTRVRDAGARIHWIRIPTLLRSDAQS